MVLFIKQGIWSHLLDLFGMNNHTHHSLALHRHMIKHVALWLNPAFQTLSRKHSHHGHDGNVWGNKKTDRREEKYKERVWGRNTEISVSSLLSMMNRSRRGHLTPVTQPASRNYLQGEDGGLAGELCTALGEIDERLKIISVTGSVFVAPSELLNGSLWSARRVFCQ